MIMHTPLARGMAVFAAALGSSVLLTAQTPSLPTFNVSNYGASGSSAYGYCSGQAGTTALTSCSFSGSTDDFQVGEGIHIVNAGPNTQSIAIPAAAIATPSNTSVKGTHTYCYVVSVADPLEGISAPSPQGASACVPNEPATLSYNTVYNNLGIPLQANGQIYQAGPQPTFLWYVSEDGQPYTPVSFAGYGNGAGGYYSAYAMDVGQQISGRGGWPITIPAGSGNINKNEEFYTTITAVNGSQFSVADALPRSFQAALLIHDDTQAVNRTINAAVQAGGGIVQFNAGSYELWRPSFLSSYSTYPTFTTSLAGAPLNLTFSYLQIPNGATGHVHLQGVSGQTLIVGAPDHAGWARFLDVGSFGRPAYGGAPAYAANSLIKIDQLAKGSTQVTLANPSTAPALKAGDDVWLYYGSFQGSCQDSNGTAGGQCHFSELNTIASVNGATVTLVYPASKTYYTDAQGNSFGMVLMPVTPHDIAIQNLEIDTFNSLLSTGMAYGVLINGVTLNKQIDHGPFGGGFKRDVTIENSTWNFGAGDVSYAATDEFDQFTNVTFNNNNIYGFAAPGAEGPSLFPRIYGTEGSSQFTFTNNHFYHAGILFDETTDDVITGNQFSDGIMAAGPTYGPTQGCYNSGEDAGDLSFNSAENIQISSNTFNIDSAYAPPYVLRAGYFNAASVTNNTITYAGTRQLSAFGVTSGTVTGNAVIFSNSYPQSSGFCVGPSQNPFAPLTLSGNTITGSTIQAGVHIPDPGFNNQSTICVQNNTNNFTSGQTLENDNPSSTPVSCTN